jgi:hypothetical protein
MVKWEGNRPNGGGGRFFEEEKMQWRESLVGSGIVYGGGVQ